MSMWKSHTSTMRESVKRSFQKLLSKCDGVNVTLNTGGWRVLKKRASTVELNDKWQIVLRILNGKRSRKKSQFLVFGTNTRISFTLLNGWGRWKSDSCSNKINGRLMIYQHQNRQTEEAFKCLTLTHNIFLSGVKNNNNNNKNNK